jgi:hypothetical protein
VPHFAGVGSAEVVVPGFAQCSAGLLEVIGDEVWGDSEWKDGTLRKLVSDTNDKLLMHKLRFEIISAMDAHYILQELPPVTPGVTGK